MSTARKIRTDAPSYVKEVVNMLEPYLKDAKIRRVNNNSWCWRIIWEAVDMDAARVCMLFDMVDIKDGSVKVSRHNNPRISSPTYCVTVDLVKTEEERGF